jgi:hypothetical protein
MKRERPKEVLIAAILNFIVGGTSMLCGLYGNTVFLALLLRLLDMGDPGRPNPFEGYGEFLQQQIPSYTMVEIGRILCMFAIGLTLVVAGTGLLLMKRWAYWATFACALITMMLHIGYVIFELAFVTPVVDRWLARPENLQFALNRIAQRYGTTRSNVQAAMFFCCYALNVVTLIWGLSVRAAFARPQHSLHDDFATDKNKEYA